MTTLIIISMYLGSYDVIQTRTFYETKRECQAALSKVKARTHKILFKGCV